MLRLCGRRLGGRTVRLSASRPVRPAVTGVQRSTTTTATITTISEKSPRGDLLDDFQSSLHDEPVNDRPTSHSAYYSSAQPYLFDVFAIIDPAQRRDPGVWVQLMASLAPAQLHSSARDLPRLDEKTHPQLQFKTDQERRLAAAALLFLADRYGGVDLVLHFGLRQSRWQLVRWIVDAVLDSEQLRLPEDRLDDRLRECVSNLAWRMRPLKQQLRGPVLTEDRPDRLLTQSVQPSSQRSLDQLTTDSPWLTKTGDDYCQIAVGRIWQSIGIMLARATTSDPKETRRIVAGVLPIIAQFHHRGMIPPAVYADPSPTDPVRGFSNVLIPKVATVLLEALSDAALREGSVDTPPEPVPDSSPDSSPDLTGFPRLASRPVRTETWLEFVLWTCVLGGWPLVAARILTFMHRYERTEPWKLTSLTNAPPDSWPAQTISADVVTATVHSIVATNLPGVGARGVSVQQATRYLVTCKDLLDRDEIALRPTPWTNLVSRLAIGGIATAADDPAAFRAVLRLAHPVLDDWMAVNASGKIIERAYFAISDVEPVNIFVLYHRLLAELVEREDATGAVAVMNDLLRFGRRNAALKWSRRPIEVSGSDLRPRERPLNPRLPPALLGRMLDLLTATGHIEAASALVFGQDKHQRFILAGMHKLEAVAAPMLRYSLATVNRYLLESVASSQMEALQAAFAGQDGSSSVSPRSVAALVGSHMAANNPVAARDLVVMIRSRLGWDWDGDVLVSVIATLLRAFPTWADSAAAVSPALDSAGESLELYSDLVSGRLGPVLSTRTPFSIESVNAVLSSVGPGWAAYCGRFNRISGGNSADQGQKMIPRQLSLPGRPFGRIIRAVAQTGRITAAARLVDKWTLRPESIPAWDEYASMFPSGPGLLSSSAVTELVDRPASWPFEAMQVPPFRIRPVMWYGLLNPPIATRLDPTVPTENIEAELALIAAAEQVREGSHSRGLDETGGSSDRPEDSVEAFDRSSLIKRVRASGRLDPILIPATRSGSKSSSENDISGSNGDDSVMLAFSGRIRMSASSVRAILEGVIERAYDVFVQRDNQMPTYDHSQPTTDSNPDPTTYLDSSTTTDPIPDSTQTPSRSEEGPRTAITKSEPNNTDSNNVLLYLVDPALPLDSSKAVAWTGIGNVHNQTTAIGSTGSIPYPTLKQLVDLLHLTSTVSVQHNGPEIGGDELVRLLLWTYHRIRWLGLVHGVSTFETEIRAGWRAVVFRRTQMVR